MFQSEAENQAAEQAKLRHKATIATLRREVAAVPERRTYQAMLDSVQDWRPPELPDLGQFEEVILDLETNGLRWWNGDRLIGAALLTPDGQSRYLPIRHKLGPNIPEDQFFEWCRRELRGKRVVNIRTKFDLHMLREDRIDLEAQGCTFGDVAHYAALLDDHRRLFNQEDLALEFLAANGVLTPEECKVKAAHGYDLDPSKFAEYPAGLVAPRAEGDVRIVSLLQKAMWPMLEEQGLHTIRKVEDSVIPVVVEMEHNGAPLDQELLHKWVQESEQDVKQALYEIKQATGIEIEKPGKRDDVIRLFNYLKVPLPIDPEDPQKVSFADSLIKHIKEPSIQNFRKAAQLESLRSKFLLKYQRSTMRDGILRYELHQLPYQDDKDAGFGGAVSGRFSSAAPMRDEGANIQQVFGVDVQKKARPYTAKYLVKQLFKPREGKLVNADASQLQFRIFAHYADDPKIIDAYKRDYQWREIEARAAAKKAAGLELTDEDKLADFHNVVGGLIRTFAHKDLIRTHVKNVNFAQVFGAGVPKMARQLGVPENQIPTQEQWGAAVREGKTHEVGGPQFTEVVTLSETYHEMFPSVKPLLAITSHLAMPSHKSGDRKCGQACRRFCAQGYEHRGWVRTFLGRRARFGDYDRHYSALNRIIQGTEADVIKRILVEVHNQRHELGLTERFTVHDAVVGDLQGDPAKLKEVLNTQYYDFRVPILWDVGVGDSWAEAK